MKALPVYPQGHGAIFQTDEGFSSRPQIRHGACYFLSITEVLSWIFGLQFTHEAILDFYDSEIDDGDMDVDNEMFIGNPQNLIDDYVGKGKVSFLGVRDPGYLCKPDEIEWGCWHRDGTDFNHFTHNDGRGRCFYDPWSREGSASVKEGKLIGKRVARLITI